MELGSLWLGRSIPINFSDKIPLYLLAVKMFQMFVKNFENFELIVEILNSQLLHIHEHLSCLWNWPLHSLEQMWKASRQNSWIDNSVCAEYFALSMFNWEHTLACHMSPFQKIHTSKYYLILFLGVNHFTSYRHYKLRIVLWSCLFYLLLITVIWFKSEEM